MTHSPRLFNRLLRSEITCGNSLEILTYKDWVCARRVPQSWRSPNSGAFSPLQEICGSNYAYDADRIRLRQHGLLSRQILRSNPWKIYQREQALLTAEQTPN